MERPPRKPGGSIMDGGMLWRVGFVSLLIGGATIASFEYSLAQGMELQAARTMAVNTLVIAQAWYLFNSRFLTASSLAPARLFTNPAAQISVLILALLQLGFVYLPVMNTWFGTTPLPLETWLPPIGIGALVFLIIEAEKALLRRRG